MDAERLVATRLQTPRLALPLALSCWPPASCARGLARADEAAARVSFHATDQPDPKLKTDFCQFFSKPKMSCEGILDN